MSVSVHTPSEGFKHANTSFFKEYLIRFPRKQTCRKYKHDKSVKCPHSSSQLKMRTDRCSAQLKFNHPSAGLPTDSHRRSRRIFILSCASADKSCFSLCLLIVHRDATDQDSLSMFARKRWAHHSSRSIGTKSERQMRGELVLFWK